MQAVMMFLLFAGIGDATKLQPTNLRSGEALKAGASASEATQLNFADLNFADLHNILFNQAAHSDPLASAARLPMVLSIALAAFFVGGKLAPYIPMGKPFGLAMCAVYVTFSVSIDVCIKMLATTAPAEAKKEGDYAFNPICMVLVTELSKLVISAILALTSGSSSENSEARKVSAADVAYLALPAAIFTVNNVLVFKALGANDTSVFGVFRDTMILWTAVLWKFVFRTDLGLTRLAAICIIFVGLVVNQFAHQMAAGRFSWAFLIVIAMTLCNASGSVANEYALKRSKGVDINIQNAVLYSLCIAFSLGLLLIDDPSRLSGLRLFFGGFSGLSWTLAGVQACAGLMVSRLLKYTDSVMKTAATCLRGPVFVAAAPLFVAGQHLNAGSITSALLVASGCFAYLSQGPMQSNANDKGNK